jgi:hypothetical protein
MKFKQKTIIFLSLVFVMNAIRAQNSKNIQLTTDNIPIKNSLEYICKLTPLTYEYNQTRYQELNLPSGKQFGFIADDVKLVLPSIVTSQRRSYLVGKNTYNYILLNTVDYEKLIPFLVDAIQELQLEINELRNRIKN